MWEKFPIQCEGMHGPAFQTIQQFYPYTEFPDVKVEEWSKVSPEVKAWALDRWRLVFACTRCPLEGSDLLAWIPEKGTLVARRGWWKGDSKSKPMITMMCNYVETEHRSKRLAEHLISTLGRKASEVWGIDAFLFELQKIPNSLALKKVRLMARFDYIWIHRIYPKTWREISELEIAFYLQKMQGNHFQEYTGYRGFVNKENRHVIVDAHDDVVAYDSFYDLFTMHRGHYVRIFHPAGSCSTLVENMYFDQPNYFLRIHC